MSRPVTYTIPIGNPSLVASNISGNPVVNPLVTRFATVPNRGWALLCFNGGGETTFTVSGTDVFGVTPTIEGIYDAQPGYRPKIGVNCYTSVSAITINNPYYLISVGLYNCVATTQNVSPEGSFYLTGGCGNYFFGDVNITNNMFVMPDGQAHNIVFVCIDPDNYAANDNALINIAGYDMGGNPLNEQWTFAASASNVSANAYYIITSIANDYSSPVSLLGVAVGIPDIIVPQDSYSNPDLPLTPFAATMFSSVWQPFVYSQDSNGGAYRTINVVSDVDSGSIPVGDNSWTTNGSVFVNDVTSIYANFTDYTNVSVGLYDRVCVTQPIVSGNNAVLQGGGVGAGQVDGVAVPGDSYACYLTITSSDDLSSVNFTVSGLDQNSSPITNIYPGPASTTFVTTDLYTAVIAVSVDGNVSNVAIGFAAFFAEQQSNTVEPVEVNIGGPVAFPRPGTVYVSSTQNNSATNFIFSETLVNSNDVSEIIAGPNNNFTKGTNVIVSVDALHVSGQYANVNIGNSSDGQTPQIPLGATRANAQVVAQVNCGADASYTIYGTLGESQYYNQYGKLVPVTNQPQIALTGSNTTSGIFTFSQPFTALEVSVVNDGVDPVNVTIIQQGE